MAQAAEPAAYVSQHSAAHSYSENIKHSRTNFFVLLLAQLYCLITIETTEDAALLSNATTQQLPILETAIGIETFYIIAPAILVIIFFHFQIHLKSFFTSMVQLARAEGRDPLALVDTYPWFVTSSMTRRFAAGVDQDRSFSGYFEYIVGLIFGWYSTAAICMMFWARYLPVHDWGVSTYHAAMTALAFAGAIQFLYASKSGLRGIKISGWRAAPRGVAVLFAFGLPFAGLLYATNWFFEAQDAANCYEASFDEECEALFAVRAQLRSIGFDANAALDGAALSEAPDNWVPPAEPTFDELLPVRGAALAGSDLRYASARDANFVRADLTDANMRLADFAGAAFHGADLSRADLYRSTLANATFDFARFSDTEMAEVDLSDATLRHATFTRATTPDVYAPGADFSNARMEQCAFPNADFRGANWTGAILNRCRFENATFDRAILRGASLEAAELSGGASISDAEGQGVVMSRARLLDVVAASSDFEGGDFYGATIEGGDFSEARFLYASMGEARISGARMTNTSFVRADFRSAVVSETDFRNSDLRDLNLHEATFTNVNLSNVDLTGAIVTEGVFTGVRLNGSDLRNTQITGSSMVASSLTGADLRRAAISNADLSAAALDGANLGEAQLTGAKLEGANLVGADLSGATLVGVRFVNADLTDANWTGANLVNVILTGADLSGAVGLEQSQLLRACSSGGETLPAGMTVRPCQ